MITFENADKPEVSRIDNRRECWGASFLVKRGYCVLGIKTINVDWYRGTQLHDFFDSIEFQLFVSSFKKVYFYVSSMGGCGALVFSSSVKDSIVIAFNPQSTFNPRLVSWDGRYPMGCEHDWSGRYADARLALDNASKVYSAYDPFSLKIIYMLNVYLINLVKL